MKIKNEKLMLKEIVHAEKKNIKISMYSIYKIYKKVDNRLFINYVMDYIWNNDIDCLNDKNKYLMDDLYEK